MFEKFKVNLNCVKRIPLPVFQITVKVFPERIKNKEELLEFLNIYCWYQLFSTEVQYELMERINQVYLAVYNSVVKEIEDNGKISITEESAET